MKITYLQNLYLDSQETEGDGEPIRQKFISFNDVI